MKNMEKRKCLEKKIARRKYKGNIEEKMKTRKKNKKCKQEKKIQ